MPPRIQRGVNRGHAMIWGRGRRCSPVVLSGGRGDGDASNQGFRAYSSGDNQSYNPSVPDFTSFFGDLTLVPPGIVDAREWHPALARRARSRPAAATPSSASPASASGPANASTEQKQPGGMS